MTSKGQDNNFNGAEWLKSNFPNCTKLDHDWTMERYDFPDYVRKHIEENWYKISDENGGTYCKTIHSKVKQSKISYGLTNKIPLEHDTGLKYAKDFKTNYSEAYNSMDKNNKHIMDVMESDGTSAAISEMFKHPDSGRTLSYAEMRSFYG